MDVSKVIAAERHGFYALCLAWRIYIQDMELDKGKQVGRSDHFITKGAIH